MQSIAPKEGKPPRVRDRRVPIMLPVSMRASAPVSSYAINISATGLFITTDAELAVGEPAKVEFALGGENYALEGRIARVERGRGIGVAFENLSRAARLSLVAYVSNRLAEEEAMRLVDDTVLSLPT